MGLESWLGSRVRRGTTASFFRRSSASLSLSSPPSRSPLCRLRRTLPYTFSELLHSALSKKRFPLRLALRLDRSVQLRKCSTPSRLISRSKCRKCSRLGALYLHRLTRSLLHGAPGTAARRTASQTVAPTATRRSTSTTTRASKNTLVRACFISELLTMPHAVADSLSSRPPRFRLFSPDSPPPLWSRLSYAQQVATRSKVPRPARSPTSYGNAAVTPSSPRCVRCPFL
jgi:hypothetical protein